MSQQETIIKDTIMGLFDELAQMPQAVPGGQGVTCHVPYWINLQTTEFAGPGGARQQALSQNNGVRTLLTNHFNVMVAKGSPSQIGGVLQTALSQGLLAGNPPTGAGLEHWMRTFGVGLDCSGFVYQALDRVNQALRDANLPGMARPFNQSKIEDQIGFVGAAEINARGMPVAVQDLRPGDTLHLFGAVDHVRILTEVAYDGGRVQFTTAESTDADNPPGAAHGIGPRIMFWRGTFMAGGSGFAGLENRRKDTDPWHSSNEHPVFARHIAWPLAIGGKAVVTQDAKIHSQPGLSDATVIFILSGNTSVTILDGPQSADGRDWWQITDDTGQSGWCSTRLLRPA